MYLCTDCTAFARNRGEAEGLHRLMMYDCRLSSGQVEVINILFRPLVALYSFEAQVTLFDRRWTGEVPWRLPGFKFEGLVIHLKELIMESDESNHLA